MEIAAIYLMLAVLVCWRKADIVAATLVAFITLGLALALLVPRGELPVGLALLEVIFASFTALYVNEKFNADDRCWSDLALRSRAIALFSCFKILLWLAYVTGDRFAGWNAVAAGNNGLLFCQILMAGGVGHEIVNRSIDSVRVFARSMRCFLGVGTAR